MLPSFPEQSADCVSRSAHNNGYYVDILFLIGDAKTAYHITAVLMQKVIDFRCFGIIFDKNSDDCYFLFHNKSFLDFREYPFVSENLCGYCTTAAVI